MEQGRVYPNANNLQDDVQVISGHIPVQTDDHGNSTASATALPLGTTFSASGLIERRTDVDVFSFVAGAGDVSISLASENTALGPNSDLMFVVKDFSGAVITSVNPVDALSAAAIVNILNAGTYFVEVEAVGKGDLITGYSDYASLGKYVLAITISNTGGPMPPNAVLGATPETGEAPLSVQFTGSNSVDADGSITSFAWDFGDNTAASTANATHVFNQPGIYTASLTVTDDSNLMSTATKIITVLAPNQLPTANVTVSASSGIAPLALTFNGSLSSDPDGTIVRYDWNFGNGTTQSSTSPQVQYSYSTAGTYTATLTVVDDRGGQSSASQVITVNPDTAKTMYVSSIALTVTSNRSKRAVQASVTVKNLNGQVVSGATVTGTFSGIVSGSASATTSSSGVATLKSKSTTRKGTVNFTISNITLNGYQYSAADNASSSASIVVQ